MFTARVVRRTILSAPLLIAPLFAQTFASPKNYPPFTDSYQFAVGDFNHDGAAGLLGVANVSGSTTIYLYLNNGSGGFGTPKAILGTSGAGGVQVGDFNRDGNLDFAFINSQKVGVSYGDGTGKFTAPVFYSVNGAPDSIAIGDFNVDGKPDIATLSDATKAVTILSNTGSSFSSSSFTVPLYFSSTNSGYPPDNIGNLVTGDFNGKHTFDLAYVDSCADAACGPGLVRIYELSNKGNNSFTPTLLNDTIGGSARLYTADVDLDGKVDMIVTSFTGGSGGDALFVEYSNGNGSFTQVYADDSTGSYGIPETVAIGDFNNDGIEDIATLTDMTLYGTAHHGFDIYTGKGSRKGFNAPRFFADNTTVSPRGGFAGAFFDQNGTRDVALDDDKGLSVFLNTTSTSGDPCTYINGTGLHRCLPASNASGPSPVHFLAAYKAAIQPAQRIEVWADGKKLFQEYGDLLNIFVPLAAGTHQLSVVGVDATGKPVKSNSTYTVTAACASPSTAGVKICSPASGSTISSPVNVSAAATASSGLRITATRLYLDYKSVYTSNSNTLNTSISLAAGSHHLTVVAYENNGSSLTASETITVK